MKWRSFCLALLALSVFAGCKIGNANLSGSFTAGLSGSIQTGPLIVK
jgi:hypothetical protein